MAACAGPLAMIGRKPRQARKGATVLTDSCAGVWLVLAATITSPFLLFIPFFQWYNLDRFRYFDPKIG